MTFPSLTLTYLAILALLYSGLSLVVVALRARNDIPFGDGGNDALHRAIRAHGNFIESVVTPPLRWAQLSFAFTCARGRETLGCCSASTHRYGKILKQTNTPDTWYCCGQAA